MKIKPYSYAWDWPLAILMLVLVYSVAARLSITSWVPDLWAVEGITFLGASLGLALGGSKFQKKAVRWLVFFYSLVSVPWILTKLISGEKTAIGQLASLAGRLGAAAGTLFQGKPVNDTLFFVTLMCSLFWFIGLFCGYQVLRRPNALSAILPSTIPLLVIQYYDGSHIQRLWIAGFYFFIAILIVGRLNLLKNREQWKENRILAGRETEFDLSRSLFVTAFLVIVVAWSLPTPAAAVPTIARFWREFTQPFENTRKKLDDMLAALNGEVAIPADIYGSSLELGRDAQQGDTEIFTAKPSEFTTVRYYWRVRTYDFYADGRWLVAGSDKISFSPDLTQAINLGIDAEKSMDFVFNWKATPTTILATPEYPLWLSRTGSFQINALNKDAYDMLSWNVSPPVQSGDQYRVQAVLFNPTIKQLRAAGGNYPDWVKQRYLQLPENIADDLRRLSQRLTAGQTTIYDKTMAVTNYLRTEMTYNLTVSPPPPGIDPVSWFLFTWKSGFCNYYASSEVLLLRAVGIPARMVVGYAPGTNQANGTYKVSAKDSHAWPEVYFPEIGWVEFEPTSSQDSIYRPSGESASFVDDRGLSERLNAGSRSENSQSDKNDQSPASGFDSTNRSLFAMQSRWLWVIIFIGVLIGVIILAWQIERRQSFTQKIPRAVKRIYSRYNLTSPAWLDQWVRWSEVTAVERAFHAVNQSLVWMGKPQAQDVTAIERAALLKKLLPAAAENIDIVTMAHEKTLYTPEPADPTAATQASWKIRYAAIRAYLRRLLTGEWNYD
jgi:transglutaminase-like putative cysteine protease